MGSIPPRRRRSWYRHITLAMLALAWLAVTAAASQPEATRHVPDDGGDPASASLIPLTVNEIRRLHATLICPAHSLGHVLVWSHWRRRHQAGARRCHYRRRHQRFLELAASRLGP